MKLDYLKLHTSVLLSGFTGVFAKLISLNEALIVLYRMFFALIFFSIILVFMKKKPNDKDAVKISLLGAVLALHLMFFFASIKWANLAVGVVCYSLVGFFTVIFEPFMCKVKFSFTELLYSLIAVVGIWLIFSFDVSFRLGIILGIISAALFALYTIFNTKLIHGKSARSMLFWELVGGTLFMLLFMPNLVITHVHLIPSGIEWLWVIVLALFCTVFLYLLYIDVLKNLSPFTVSLAGNLEPVYGILLAIVFLGEVHELSISFYLGMVLILLSVFLQSFTKAGTYSNRP